MDVRLLKEGQDQLQKILMEIFPQEFQKLNSESQSILVDDLLTVFRNRLKILKNIQHNKVQSQVDTSSVPEPRWLTKDLKKEFKFEVRNLENGLRLTKLILNKKKI